MAVRLDVPGLDLADLHRRYTAGAASIKGEAERLGVSRKFLSKRYNRWLQAGGAAALDPQAPKPAPRLEASDKVTATGLKTGGLVLDSAQSPRIRTLAQLVEAGQGRADVAHRAAGQTGQGNAEACKHHEELDAVGEHHAAHAATPDVGQHQWHAEGQAGTEA